MDCKSVHPGSIPGVASNLPRRASSQRRSTTAREPGHSFSAGLLVGRLLVLDSVHLAVLAFAAMPPHGELAAPAPHDGEIDREHEKPKRDHPKAEHGQEADETANHEQNAEPDADRLRLRQVPVALKRRTLWAIGRLALVAGQAGHKGYAGAPQPAPSSRQAATSAGSAQSSGKAPCLLLSTRS